MTELEQARKFKDEFFANDAHSPLEQEQKESFEGLNYYPENEALRFEIDIEPYEDQELVDLTTSTGDIKTYKRYGRFSFPVDGQQVELTLFASPHGYFLPFVDANAGNETYGAGRYLDPEQQEDGSFLIDFNEAYNPYCAYNENWNCPLPPGENRLKVAIPAGEKNFKASN